MYDTKLQRYENAQSNQCTVRHGRRQLYCLYHDILTCFCDVLNTYINRYRNAFSFLKEQHPCSIRYFVNLALLLSTSLSDNVN